MTVPSDIVKMTDVRAEFGGSAATPLSAYLRGGPFVPIQTLGNIPTALPLNLRSFVGANYPAAVAYVGNTPSNGFSTGSAVVAPDLSTMTFVIQRTKTVNGLASIIDSSDFLINFNVSGAVNPVIVLRSRATVQDVNGRWKIANAWDFKVQVSPGQLAPAVAYATYEGPWTAEDVTDPYRGDLVVFTPLPTSAGASPPTRQLDVVGGAFSIRMTVRHKLDRTSGAAVAMSWNTRNVSNTFVEYPLAIDVYDGGVLRASYNVLLHFELNSQFTLNP